MERPNKRLLLLNSHLRTFRFTVSFQVLFVIVTISVFSLAESRHKWEDKHKPVIKLTRIFFLPKKKSVTDLNK